MFEDANFIYLFKKEEGHSNKFYFLKCKYLSSINLTPKNFNYYNNLANKYVHTKINGCIYD